MIAAAAQSVACRAQRQLSGPVATSSSSPMISTTGSRSLRGSRRGKRSLRPTKPIAAMRPAIAA
jgi:hypothetical protein